MKKTICLVVTMAILGLAWQAQAAEEAKKEKMNLVITGPGGWEESCECECFPETGPTEVWTFFKKETSQTCNCKCVVYGGTDPACRAASPKEKMFTFTRPAK
ncbi:hypothetical protein ACUUL3_07160 [Thiovibrio sp. JS02]